jgi:hypothetical protein
VTAGAYAGRPTARGDRVRFTTAAGEIAIAYADDPLPGWAPGTTGITYENAGYRYVHAVPHGRPGERGTWHWPGEGRG